MWGRSRGKSAFLFSEFGGPPRGIGERLRAQSLLRALSPQCPVTVVLAGPLCVDKHRGIDNKWFCI